MKPKIKLRRKFLGIKTKEAAKKLNISISTFYKVEEGHRRPSSRVIARMAGLYNCSIDEIYRDLNLLEQSNL